MVTFTAVVLAHQKRADGSYNVKIRVTFKRRSRYMATSIICGPGDVTRGMKIKNPAIRIHCDVLVNRLREAAAVLDPFVMAEMDVDWVVNAVQGHLSANAFRLDFFAFADEFMSQRRTPATQMGYMVAVNSFERFLGERRLDINAITRGVLMKFKEHVETSPKLWHNTHTGEVRTSSHAKAHNGTAVRYIAKIGSIYKAARDRYNDEDSGVLAIPRNPFASLKLVEPPPVTAQKSIGIEAVQKVISSSSDVKKERLALDAFVLSFGLMGANVADLYEAKPFDGDVWTYNRKKTRELRADRAEIHVRIPDCLRPFLDRLGAGTSSEWWLPVLHNSAVSSEKVTALLNKRLTRWAQVNGVPRFTMYAARHSWATIARSRSVGIDKATVDECLCHVGDYQMTDIYAERDWSTLWEANDKVLSLFDWKKD